jgi:hypothetical protein
MIVVIVEILLLLLLMGMISSVARRVSALEEYLHVRWDSQEDCYTFEDVKHECNL